jgi:hypothetical protein
VKLQRLMVEHLSSRSQWLDTGRLV